MPQSSRALSALALLWLVACSNSADPAPPVEGLSVSPASEVRQGQSEVVISFGRAAGGLSTVSNVALDDLALAIDPKSTDTRLSLNVTVPHGVAPGPRTLTFDTADGTTTEAAALDVTPITVAIDGKDAQPGTTGAPFRTLRAALAVAGPGDTCVLGGGSYDAASGETWGYAVPDPLTIQGEPTQPAILQGPAHPIPVDGSPTGPIVDALEPSSMLALKQITLADFDIAIDLKQTAQASLEDVTIQGNGKGIVAEAGASTIALKNGSLSSASFGVDLSGTCDGCALSIDGTVLTESGDGPIVNVSETAQHSALTFSGAQLNGGVFVADTAATLTVDGSHLVGNGANAALNFQGAQLDAKDSDFQAASAAYGINLNGGQMTLNDVTVEGNRYCVYQLSGHSKVRGCKLSNYSSIGFYFAKGDLDLGTATDAGDNVFEGVDGNAFGLYVDTDTTPLSCSNTSFDGILPETGSVTADTEILTEPHEYLLVPGRTISFFRVP